MEKVNLAEKFSLFSDYWNPRIVAELNGQYVKMARLKGAFIWHTHPAGDEMFLVIEGRLSIEFRDRTVTLERGEFLVVPRGVEHRPVADQEAQVLFFEPASTLNTGNVRNDRTVEKLKRL